MNRWEIGNAERSDCALDKTCSALARRGGETNPPSDGSTFQAKPLHRRPPVATAQARNPDNAGLAQGIGG